MILPLDFILGE